ncbi:hypothetical protein ScPMuIL_000394 [Solemya velum]
MWDYLGSSVLTLVLVSNLAVCERLRPRRNTGWLVGTKPPGTVCSLNPCKQRICLNGGACILDEDTCHFKCDCTDDFDGLFCEQRAGGAPDNAASVTKLTGVVTTLKPLSERECIPGFVCSHGVCDQEKKRQGMFACVCDPAWTGVFCNQYVPTTSNSIVVPTTQSSQQTTAVVITERDLSLKMCSDTFVCMNGICDQHGSGCLCDPGWTGTFCASKICDLVCGPDEECVVHTEDTFTCEPVATPDYTTEVATPDGLFLQSSVCTTGTLRPDIERRCLPNLVCKYGRCSDVGLKCLCDPGGYGQLCEDKCCLNCLSNGTCRLFENGTAYCDCPDHLTGKQCERHKPEPITQVQQDDQRYLYVLGACVGVLLLLLVTSLLLLYWMWRRRVILVMKVVHFFQPYEDDDDRVFDAFISYKSAEIDEHFVVHTLYPKLEKEMGFKLCMHFRDFVPGENISNNIINAINNSRRTILLLSPRYIDSDWAKLEYQVAQREMLKRRHLIVPIVLEDFSDSSTEIDPNLKAIINSVTYIEWPGIEREKKLNKFWERVRLSMPKTKRQSALSQSSSDSQGIANVGYINSDSEITDMCVSGNDDVENCMKDGYKYVTMNQESAATRPNSVTTNEPIYLEMVHDDSGVGEDFRKSMSDDDETAVDHNGLASWETIDLQPISVKL